MARWYDDKAVNVINAKLALTGAGAGANAFSQLAKIPLDIDDRNMADRKLKIDEAALGLQDKKIAMDKEIASLRSNTSLSVTEQKAGAKIVAAKYGFDGRKVTADARDRSTTVDRKNNINTNITEHDKMANNILKTTMEGEDKKAVAKIRSKAKAPTQEEYSYDTNGNRVKKVNRAYAPPVDFTLDALDEVAKKAKKKKS